MPDTIPFDEHEEPLSGGSTPQFIGSQEEINRDFKYASVSNPISVFETAVRYIDERLDYGRYLFTISKDMVGDADRTIVVLNKDTMEPEWVLVFKDGIRHRIVMPRELCVVVWKGEA